MAFDLSEEKLKNAAFELGSAIAVFDASPAAPHVFSREHCGRMEAVFSKYRRRRNSGLKRLAASAAVFVIVIAAAFAFVPEVSAAARKVISRLGIPGTVLAGVEMAQQLQYSSVQNAVDKYVEYLKSDAAKALAKSGNYIYSADPGNDPSGASDPKYDKDLRYMEEHKAERFALIAQNQRAHIVSEFGDGAWDNVTFYRTIYPYSRMVREYRFKSTGKRISIQEYEEILWDYWQKAAEKEGLEPEDLIRDGYYSEKAEKYLDAVPVEAVFADDTETYRITLLFYGKEFGSSGRSYSFLVSGKEDVWEISSGLSWDSGWYWYQGVQQ